MFCESNYIEETQYKCKLQTLKTVLVMRMKLIIAVVKNLSASAKVFETTRQSQGQIQIIAENRLFSHEECR